MNSVKATSIGELRQIYTQLGMPESYMLKGQFLQGILLNQVFKAEGFPSASSTYQVMDWWIENACLVSPPCRFARPRPMFWNFIYGRRALGTPALLFA